MDFLALFYQDLWGKIVLFWIFFFLKVNFVYLEFLLLLPHAQFLIIIDMKNWHFSGHFWEKTTIKLCQFYFVILESTLMYKKIFQTIFYCIQKSATFIFWFLSMVFGNDVNKLDFNYHTNAITFQEIVGLFHPNSFDTMNQFSLFS